MAVEAARGCGFRQVGGLYLVADGMSASCGMLPIPLDLCPLCGHGIKQARGLQWVHYKLLHEFVVHRCKEKHCAHCRIGNPVGEIELGGVTETVSRLTPEWHYGMIWIGATHYASAQTFTKEALELGVSRRVKAIPKGLVVGETLVLVAHPKGYPPDATHKDPRPGVFHAFVPKAIDLIVTPAMREEDWVKRYEQKGVRLIEVPEDDPDHNRRLGRPPTNPQQRTGQVPSAPLFDDLEEDFDE